MRKFSVWLENVRLGSGKLENQGRCGFRKRVYQVDRCFGGGSIILIAYG
jgi:hypothetical protein